MDGNPVSDSLLQRRIALKLDAGELPRQAPRQRWGGVCRTGHSCQLCGEAIPAGAAEVETEDADGVYRVFHAGCSALLEQVRTAIPA